MAESTSDVIKRYLQDAVAAEKSFETQLNAFAKEGGDRQVQALFQQHALETRNQYERLTVRLETVGGSTSPAKSLLAHVFSMAPKTASIGHEPEERATQNLLVAYAVENSEVAMYESLAAIAEAAGDTETASLARSIQEEERATAEKIWAVVPTAATAALARITGQSTRAATP